MHSFWNLDKIRQEKQKEKKTHKTTANSLIGKTSRFFGDKFKRITLLHFICSKKELLKMSEYGVMQNTIASSRHLL